LHKACAEGHDFANALLSFGADPNLLDNDGQSPLHLLAINRNRKELVSLTTKILKRGAKTDVKNKKGQIPFDFVQKSEIEGDRMRKLLTPGFNFKRDF
jgi:ankyrin repeat protein